MRILFLFLALVLSGCLATSSIKHTCSGECSLEVDRSVEAVE